MLAEEEEPRQRTQQQNKRVAEQAGQNARGSGVPQPDGTTVPVLSPGLAVLGPIPGQNHGSDMKHKAPDLWRMNFKQKRASMIHVGRHSPSCSDRGRQNHSDPYPGLSQSCIIQTDC